MWEKWVFLAALAGITCLMRAPIGDVEAAGGADLADALLDECRAIAESNGRIPRPSVLESFRGRLTAPGSLLAASMLTDLERGGRTEADHVLGDLLRRRPDPPAFDRSLLRLAYTALKAQETRAAARIAAHPTADLSSDPWSVPVARRPEDYLFFRMPRV